MSKLKDINLNDLGIKKEKELISTRFLNNSYNFMNQERDLAETKSLYSSYDAVGRKQMSKACQNYYNNYSTPMKLQNKLLPYINLTDEINEKEAIYIDINKQIECEQNEEVEEFLPPQKLGETIPLTFHKFFYQIARLDISKFALEKSKELPNLIEGIKASIWKNAAIFLNKQIGKMICQVANYSVNATIFKKAEAFQKSEEVINWIIDTSLKMRYDSANWNLDQKKTFSEELLLITDTSLYQRIKMAEYREGNQISPDKKENRKIPLPLNEVWDQFAAVITFPLPNNFQFIIIDKKALVGWYKLQKLEIKYDEEKSLTYFLRKIGGGFKQLTYYNACAFIGE